MGPFYSGWIIFYGYRAPRLPIAGLSLDLLYSSGFGASNPNRAFIVVFRVLIFIKNPKVEHINFETKCQKKESSQSPSNFLNFSARRGPLVQFPFIFCFLREIELIFSNIISNKHQFYPN